MPKTLELAEQRVDEQIEAERSERIEAELAVIEAEQTEKAARAEYQKKCKEVAAALRKELPALYESDEAIESLIIALMDECRNNVDRQNVVTQLLASIGSNELTSIGSGYRPVDKLWGFFMGRCKPLFQRLVPNLTNADASRWGGMSPAERDRQAVGNVCEKYKLDIG